MNSYYLRSRVCNKSVVASASDIVTIATHSKLQAAALKCRRLEHCFINYEDIIYNTYNMCTIITIDMLLAPSFPIGLPSGGLPDVDYRQYTYIAH